MNARHSFLLVLTFFSVTFCRAQDPFSFAVNSTISEELRAEMYALTDSLMKAIQDRDEAVMQQLFSSEFRANMVDSIFFNYREAIGEKPFWVKDQFWVKNPREGAMVPVFHSSLNYTLNNNAVRKEEYLLLIHHEDSIARLMTFLSFGKEGAHWELNRLFFNASSYFGKDALDYYALSQEALDKGHLLNAFLHIQITGQLIKPVGPILQYQDEAQIIALKDTIFQSLEKNYELPIILKKVTTQPKIMRIFPQMVDSGFYPMVIYQSEIPLEDLKALGKECTEMHKTIEEVFPGIKKFNKEVLYRAINKDFRETGEYYGFIKKSD